MLIAFPNFINSKIKETDAYFGAGCGIELVDQIERYLLPYNAEIQPIYLLQKNGEILTLDESPNQILSSFINQLNTKYILSFPREI